MATYSDLSLVGEKEAIENAPSVVVQASSVPACTNNVRIIRTSLLNQMVICIIPDPALWKREKQ